MTRFRVLPYKQGSKSAKALANELGGKVLKLEGSKFKAKASDVIINWGSTVSHPCLHGPLNICVPRLLNDWEDISDASNKLKFFQLLKEKCSEVIPQFWTNKDSIPSDAYPVICRTVLSGHSGAGIVIADDDVGLVDAPLYVQYIKKKDEYRVHIGRGSDSNTVTIAVQRKTIPNGTTPKSWAVRNLDNGFIYVRNNVNPPESVIEEAHKAFKATALDFGAVDVIWNEAREKAYVLEINTAPGLEGQTIKDYADFFRTV